METERFINVRKLAAIDIVYRGPRTILLEFGFGVFFLGVLGFAFLVFVHQRTTETTAIGAYLLLLGLNYIPLLAYSVSIAMRGSAKAEVAFELAHGNVYRRKYGVQQALILVPLAIPLLTLVQEARKPAPAGRGVDEQHDRA